MIAGLAVATSDAIAELDAYALAEAIRGGEVSPVDAVAHALDRVEALDDKLGAFTVTFPDEAREAAIAAERRARSGERLPLLGVPISIKDHIWVKGAPATNGSLALRDFIPAEDCALVTRVREAGAIIIGKTNNPEFVYRGFTDNAVFGLTRNPWNLDRTPGGSSGGSGAAVAAGMAPLSVGTDGGGSIRIPACFCGIVGLKPTFGLVPKMPGFRGWPTLSVDGPMTRTVRDSALLLSVIAGIDPLDDLSFPRPPVDYLASAMRADDLSDLRVAYTEDMGFAPVDTTVREAFRNALATFGQTGCELVAAYPDTGDTADLWWRIVAAEGFASEGPLLAEHESVMTEGTPEIIRSGERITAREYLDAQHERARFARQWGEFFTEFDLLVAPSMQVPAFPVGQSAPAEVEGRRCDPLFEDWCSMIYVANLTNQPSLAVPIGRTSDGLPLGMQIIARRFEDHLALRAGAAWQRLMPWDHEWPPIAHQST
jgi:Asp-tRNA(Asn)/Glu-tRNA(Gln) amidotransferase A subunit family amidase